MEMLPDAVPAAVGANLAENEVDCPGARVAAESPLKLKPAPGQGDLWGFGDGKKAVFWIKQGKPDPAAIHWGFMAEDEVKVDEFYRAAISAGARNNISPRARLEYYPGYYAADVFDPDGYSFEVVHKS